jgi:hypothetical protein
MAASKNSLLLITNDQQLMIGYRPLTRSFAATSPTRGEVMRCIVFIRNDGFIKVLGQKIS